MKRKREVSDEELNEVYDSLFPEETDYFSSQGEGDALCNEAYDALFPEECDFFCSQGEGDRLCNEAYDEMFPEQPIHEDHDMNVDDYRQRGEEQMGGNPLGRLFEFELRQIGPRRRWNQVVAGVHYHAELNQLREPVRGDNIGVALSEALFDVIHDELRHHPRARHINFSLTAHGFTHAFQSANFQVHEFLERSFRLDDMLRTLAGKLNSNQSFDPQRGFQLDILFVYNPPPASGRGRKRQVGLKAWEKVSKKKQCIIRIQNPDDPLCCARATVTMKAWADYKEKEEQLKDEQKKDNPDPNLLEQLNNEWKRAKNKYTNMRDGRDEQERLAKHLHSQAGVPEGPCGLPELKKFQEYLYTQTPSYQVQVMCKTKPFALLYQGNHPAPLKINLLKSDHHFDGCTSFPAFVNRSYWCDLCGKGYDHEDAKNHPCEGRICRSCNSKTCPDYVKNTRPHQPCPHCNGLFFGSTCFQEHQRSGLCDSFKHCLKCSAEYQVIPGKPHRCYFAKCKSCEKFVNIQEHKCYIQPIKEEEDSGKKKKKKPLKPLFVYADIEAMTMPDRSFEVNLLCYRTSEEDTIHSHWGIKGCYEFLEELDALTEVKEDEEEDRERPIITIFHNLKGFDGLFILSELYEQQRDVEKQLTVGAKVLSFKVGSLTFKDSLCFLPMKLSAFTKTFGLTELKKGYFPHQFNTPENQEYVGSIPDKSYYDPDGMMEKDKKAFELWHAEQVRNEVVFDFKKELEEYCHSDVALLQGGCEAFSKEFKEQADFNAFAECVTIASACNSYWRRHHLPENTIAVEPPRGWRGANVNQSKKALQWLYYQESLIPKEGACAERIKHVRNGGEQSVFTGTDPFFVDGFDPQTNTVYEFHGCLWHGCTHCFRCFRNTKHSVNPDRTLNELYRDTQFKMASLKNSGLNVVEMWECEWDRLIQQDPQVKAFVDTLTFVEPLEPRDAFFGGRTGAVALYDTIQGEEEIHYMDVTSLYPWVNKTGLYPIGHPIILSQPEQSLDPYFGVAKVDILPPTGLYHPVLPVRHGGKLTFPLCQACVQDNQAKDMLERVSFCDHSDEQRMLRGTWCTPEIEKAIQVGYQLKRVHEVWHFEESKTGLFKEYVNTWLKIKQESAGWPRHCTTEEEKQAYLDKYEREEGITLERDKIEENPGRKQTAKLMLNSFWGKFGERENKPQTVQVQTPAALYNFLDDETKDISQLRICTADNLEIVYTNVKDNVCHSSKTNVFIAAFTTCWARLKLYEHLEALQTQVLYYDTDSVIYKWTPGFPKIQTGDLLGEMTDELEDGDVIEEFVAGGAKNYGYRTKQGKFECKVRGFTLNVRGKEKLNYESMKKHILDEVNDPLQEKRVIAVTNPNFFVRDTTDKSIHLQKRIKNYGLVFDKRVLNPETLKSEPYGFRRVREEIDLLMDL